MKKMESEDWMIPVEEILKIVCGKKYLTDEESVLEIQKKLSTNFPDYIWVVWFGAMNEYPKTVELSPVLKAKYDDPNTYGLHISYQKFFTDGLTPIQWMFTRGTEQ